MPQLKFVENSEKYFEFIRKLRNNPKIKTGFIEQGYIGREQQILYMEEYGKNFFIALSDGQPVGYIGVVDDDIRIAVDPKFQHQGIGSFLVNKIKKKFPRAFAKIKIENKASRTLFTKAGFKPRYQIFEQGYREKIQKLVIYGSSYLEVLRLVDAINMQAPTFKIIGLIDDLEENQKKSFFGTRVLGGREMIPRLLKEKNLLFFNNVNSTLENKKKIIKFLKKNNCKISSLIHPKVDVSYTKIGEGSIISDGCIVGSGAKIGSFLTTRFGAIISHDVELGDYVFVGPGSNICGHVKIGDGSYIGAGSTILPRLKIGKGSVVGAGSVVTRDLPDQVIACGVPAKIIKERPGDSYRGKGM